MRIWLTAMFILYQLNGTCFAQAEMGAAARDLLVDSQVKETETRYLSETCKSVRTVPSCKVREEAANVLSREIGSCKTKYLAAKCDDFLDKNPSYRAHKINCDFKEVCAENQHFNLAEGCTAAGIEFSKAVTGDCKKGWLQGVCIAGHLIHSSFDGMLPYVKGPLLGGRTIGGDMYRGAKQAIDYSRHLACLDSELQNKVACYVAVNAGLVIVTRGVSMARFNILVRDVEALELGETAIPKPASLAAKSGQTEALSDADREPVKLLTYQAGRQELGSRKLKTSAGATNVSEEVISLADRRPVLQALPKPSAGALRAYDKAKNAIRNVKYTSNQQHIVESQARSLERKISEMKSATPTELSRLRAIGDQLANKEAWSNYMEKLAADSINEMRLSPSSEIREMAARGEITRYAVLKVIVSRARQRGETSFVNIQTQLNDEEFREAFQKPFFDKGAKDANPVLFPNSPVHGMDSHLVQRDFISAYAEKEWPGGTRGLYEFMAKPEHDIFGYMFDMTDHVENGRSPSFVLRLMREGGFPVK